MSSLCARVSIGKSARRHLLSSLLALCDCMRLPASGAFAGLVITLKEPLDTGSVSQSQEGKRTLAYDVGSESQDLNVSTSAIIPYLRECLPLLYYR